MTGRIIKREMMFRAHGYELVTTRETGAQARKRRAEERKTGERETAGCLPLQEPPQKEKSADLPFEKYWGKDFGIRP